MGRHVNAQRKAARHINALACRIAYQLCNSNNYLQPTGVAAWREKPGAMPTWRQAITFWRKKSGGSSMAAGV